MNDRIRLAVRFDPTALRSDLALLEDSDWVDHFVTRNYEGTWSVVALRAPAGAVHPIRMIYSDPGCESFVDTPFLARCRYFQQVLASFQCPLHAVRLMKLTPGSTIKPHHDHDLALEHGRARLHIPITTNPGVNFLLNGTPVGMSEGECWYLRLSDPHSAANRGRADRVHLVVDAVVNPWLLQQLRDADRAGEEPALESDVDRFRRAVLQDARLARQLSRVDDRTAFIALASQLASELGYQTTPGELDAAMREARRLWREPASIDRDTA